MVWVCLCYGERDFSVCSSGSELAVLNGAGIAGWNEPMKDEPQNTINTLNKVIAALRDSQECLRKAAEKAENADLKLILMDFPPQRAGFAGELQNEIERLGNPDPRDEGTIS